MLGYWVSCTNNIHLPLRFSSPFGTRCYIYAGCLHADLSTEGLRIGVRSRPHFGPLGPDGDAEVIKEGPGVPGWTGLSKLFDCTFSGRRIWLRRTLHPPVPLVPGRYWMKLRVGGGVLLPMRHHPLYGLLVQDTGFSWADLRR